MGVAVGTEEGQFCDPVIIQWCVIDGFFYLSITTTKKALSATTLIIVETGVSV